MEGFETQQPALVVAEDFLMSNEQMQATLDALLPTDDDKALRTLLENLLVVCKTQEDELRAIGFPLSADRWETARHYLKNVAKYIQV